MKKTPREQRGAARVQLPERRQVEMQFLSLDQWLDKDHRVRIIWQYAESLDLSELYEKIKATTDNVGRDAIDPRILFALWLLATIEGVTSARRLADLTSRDIPYRWICGGVSVNHHRLSDFRIEHGQLLERILVDSIGVLLHQKLVTLQTVAQDGMRVRASAGASSFRREKTLTECLAEAEAHLKSLRDQHDDDPSGDDRRAKSAADRAAREKVERLTRAKAEIEALNEQRQKNRIKSTTQEARASTTDPESRRMKMADGGFRPAFNVQLATDGDSRLIVGVDVVSSGGDQGQMGLMHEKLRDQYGQTPEAYLVDGGFSANEDIVRVEQRGTKVYGVLQNEQKLLDEGKDPYAAKPYDPPEMAAYRARMGTPEAQQKYSQRSSIAEFSNAECRNRGLTQFRVRGLVKVKVQTLWHALAHNFNRLCGLDYLKIVMAT
jgi:transposase